MKVMRENKNVSIKVLLIGSTLTKIGLQKYVKLFEDNDLSVDIWPDMSVQEWKELGLKVGAIKKIQTYIFRSDKHQKLISLGKNEPKATNLS